MLVSLLLARWVPRHPHCVACKHVFFCGCIAQSYTMSPPIEPVGICTTYTFATYYPCWGMSWYTLTHISLLLFPKPTHPPPLPVSRDPSNNDFLLCYLFPSLNPSRRNCGIFLSFFFSPLTQHIKMSVASALSRAPPAFLRVEKPEELDFVKEVSKVCWGDAKQKKKMERQVNAPRVNIKRIAQVRQTNKEPGAGFFR